jgi:hypothetical protein
MGRGEMKLLLTTAILGICVIPAGCTSVSRTEIVTVTSGDPCAPRNAGFYQVAAELNRVQNCVRNAICSGSNSNIETKEIAGSTNPLWGISNTAVSFNPAAQNGFLANARARAVAARPGAKAIVSITFFTSIIVANPTPTYGFIGATATYADCLATPPRD